MGQGRRTPVRGFAEVARIRGTPVYVHWSVIVIGGLILFNAAARPVETLVALVSYLAVLLVHEYGHARAARRRGYAVWSIALYPIHGVTRVDAPRTRFDACVIAWGGVVAQLVVAAPLIAWVSVFGFTRNGAVNAVLALLGWFSAIIAITNLLPLRRLDGATAWSIVPLLWQRWRRRRESRAKTGWIH